MVNTKLASSPLSSKTIPIGLVKKFTLRKKALGTSPNYFGCSKATFERLGFERATMTVIAALAGVSKATLYSYFSSKDELFIELVESFVDQHKGMLQNICEGGSADIYNDDVRSTIALLQPSEDIASTLKLLGERVLGTFFTPQKSAVRRMIISSSRDGEIGRLFYVPKALRNFRRLGLRTQFKRLSKILSLVLKSIFRLCASDTKGYRGVVKQACQLA